MRRASRWIPELVCVVGAEDTEEAGAVGGGVGESNERQERATCYTTRSARATEMRHRIARLQLELDAARGELATLDD